jgi:hypothetical protein
MNVVMTSDGGLAGRWRREALQPPLDAMVDLAGAGIRQPPPSALRWA